MATKRKTPKGPILATITTPDPDTGKPVKHQIVGVVNRPRKAKPAPTIYVKHYVDSVDADGNELKGHDVKFGPYPPNRSRANRRLALFITMRAVRRFQKRRARIAREQTKQKGRVAA